MTSKKTPKREPTLEDHQRKFSMQLRYNKKNVLEGTMIAIDPGQYGGWALFKMGTYKKGGSWKAKGKNFDQRLRDLGSIIMALPSANLLLIEYIHHPNEKTKLGSWAKLLQAIGVIKALVDREYIAEVHPHVWQGELGEEYVKSTDEADARQMGEAVIRIAKGQDQL